MDGKTDNSSVAANNLRAVESRAGSNAPAQAEDSLAGARENESEAGGLYTGSGREQNIQGSGKAKGFFKRKGPMALIIGLIFGVGGIMGGAQLFQPFSLIEQFRETFNSMQVSANMRSNAFFNMQMDTGRVKNPIKGRLFRSDTFKLSSRQQQRLSKQGIDYDDDFEGTGTRVLKFDDGTGEIRIVAADEKSARALTELNLKKFNTDYNSEAVSFKNLYEGNADFFNGYNKGSLTWRGAIANWFGTLTAKFLGSNKITRNLFQDFQKKVAEANDGNTKKVALEMIAKGAEDIQDGGMKVVGANEETTDSDGNTKTGAFDSDDVAPDKYKAPEGAKYKADDISPEPSVIKRSSLKTEADVRTKLNDISGKVQQGANIACTVMNTFGAINMVVTASEALQIINLVTSYFEAIDKTKAGYGSEVPINELTSALNETKENTNTVLVSTGTWNSSDETSNFIDDGKGGVKTLGSEKRTTVKSAMQSSGIAALYGGGSVDPNDPSVKSFNFASNIKRVVGGLGTSMEAFETCAVTKIAANAVSAITSAIEIAGCILGAVGAAFTFGMSSAACGPLVGKIVKGIALSVAIGVTVAGLISAITPVVSNMLTRDLITDIGGEDLGNALTSGANMYLGNTHRSNGGSLANRTKYTNFALAQRQVIAENAKYERSQRSPFDITSKYTFMGNLMTQMMSFLSVNTVIGAVTSTASTISSSVAALSPTALAYDISNSLPTEEEYADTCPYLASIGAIGDAYCNPYSITDTSTIGVDPADVINVLDKENSFLDEVAEDGNVIINGKSDLAKYILYCDNRPSAFGIVDQNIANELGSWGSVQTESSTFNNVANSAIGAIPIIGDTIDVVSNMDLLANIGYIGGQSCVAGNRVKEESVAATESPSWDTAKYYQRFIEDQSLAETMGLIGEDGKGKSAVTAFLDDYYEEHPLDNSYEGILARYSGLTKDTVVALLDTLDYYNYIANYDASTRYAFGAPAVEESHELLFDNENQLASNVYIILLNDIEFADVRNRNFVV